LESGEEKKSMKSFKYLGLAAGFCLASASFGQNTLKLAGVGNVDVNVIYGSSTVDTVASPYSMSLNGLGSVPMYCDDSADDITVGQEWYINSGTALSTITNGTNVASVYYDGVTGLNLTDSSLSLAQSTLTQAQQYVAAVDLAVLISTTPADSADASLAIWDLFTPSTGAGTMVLTAQAKTDLQNAIIFAQNLTYPSDGYLNIGGKSYTATIYTPLQSTNLPPFYSVPGETVANNTTIANEPSRPQEFLALSVPEPSSLAALGFDFVGAGIVGLYFLRRKSRARL
jgi:hypothetical protein